MPIYVYRCLKCGKETEKIQKFSDPPLQSCESCGGPVEKVLHPPAIHFKGSGWYVTDYARKSSPSPQEEKESPAVSDREKTASKTDGSSKSDKSDEEK